MSVSFKTDGVEISALRDRAMFNTFAGNTSYVIKDIGDELSVTYSSNSFVVELGTGEAVICGGSMLSEGTADAITLGENENGYLVIEVDLSQSGNNICKFKNVPVLTQENINGVEGYVYDLPLYQYSTTTNGVQNMVDVRLIKSSSMGEIYFTTEGNDIYAVFKNGDQEVKKELGSLNPATLTATPPDVLSGKTFGGKDVNDPQTGTMTNYSVSSETVRKTFTPSTSAQSYTIPTGYYSGSNVVKVNAVSLTGNANVGDVLSGKTFYATALSKATGTMPSKALGTNSASMGKDNTGIYAYIPYGYYPQYKTSGNSYIYLPAAQIGTAAQTEVLSGKTFTSSAGVKLSGSMTNQGAKTSTYYPKYANQSYTIPAGYHNGSGVVNIRGLRRFATLTNVNQTAGTVTTSSLDTNGYTISIATLMFTYNSASGGAQSANWKIQGSSNNSSWTDLKTGSVTGSASQKRNYNDWHTVSNYRYYRAVIEYSGAGFLEYFVAFEVYGGEN